MYNINNEEIQISILIKECQENANKHGCIIEWKKSILDNKILSIGDALFLCHSELSEALEAYRDDNKEHFNEEISDELIRLFHLYCDLNINIEEEIYTKMNKNKLRPVNHGRKNY